MADTKVSGLAAAASFLTTHEIPVNEAGTSKKITGTQIMAALPSGTQGAAWYATVTANQGTFTTITDLTSLTVTVTVVSGKRIKITGYASLSSSVAGDWMQLLIREGATTLQTNQVATPGFSGGSGFGVPVQVVLTPTAGAHTYKLSALRSAGTGLITMDASATQPAFILVEDIGI